MTKTGIDDPPSTAKIRIALTSCIAKLMEKMVSSRLYHILESTDKFAPCQAGFRKGRSAEEQLARVTQEIFDALESSPPRRSVLALLDFSTAYDTVWKCGLYSKLDDLGVPKCMIRWIRGFLTDRRARVRWGSTKSR